MDATEDDAEANDPCGAVPALELYCGLEVGKGHSAAVDDQTAVAEREVAGAAHTASCADAVGVRRRVTGKRRPPEAVLPPQKRFNAAGTEEAVPAGCDASAAEHSFTDVQLGIQPQALRGEFGPRTGSLPDSAARVGDAQAENAACGVRGGARRCVDVGKEGINVVEVGGSIPRIGIGGVSNDAAQQGELNTIKYTSTSSRPPPLLPMESEGAHQAAIHALTATASRDPTSGR